MPMKSLEPNADRAELLGKWGDATSNLFAAYLQRMSDEQRLSILDAIADGTASLVIEGSIFPTRFTLKLERLDLADAVVLANIQGGDAVVN